MGAAGYPPYKVETGTKEALRGVGDSRCLGPEGRSGPKRCAARSGLWVPFEVRRLGRSLLDQQMWCFGRDIVRREGNLLVEHGFVKSPSPPESAAPSSYSLRAAPGGEIRLWGFAILYSSGPWALVLKRGGFSPGLVATRRLPDRVWSLAHLPVPKKPGSEQEIEAARLRLAETFAWLGSYEAWVRKETGIAYRQSCLASWKNAVVPAERMAEAWHNLALHFRSARCGQTV